MRGWKEHTHDHHWGLHFGRRKRVLVWVQERQQTQELGVEVGGILRIGSPGACAYSSAPVLDLPPKF